MNPRTLTIVGWLVINAALISINAVYFLVASGQRARSMPTLNDILHNYFYAIQTFTGGSYELGMDQTSMTLAVGCVFMVIGTISWAILTSLIAERVIRGDDDSNAPVGGSSGEGRGSVETINRARRIDPD